MFVGRLIFSQALGYEARGCERSLGRKKNQNLTRHYFKKIAKKNYPYSGHHRVSVKRQSFRQFQWNFVNEMMNT